MNIESLTLPAAFATKLKRTIQFVLQSVNPRDWTEKLVVTRLIAHLLLRASSELAAALERQRDPGGPAGILIRNLPVDDTTEETPVADAVSLAVGSILGLPFQYVPGPDDDRLVARLEPKPHLQGVKDTGQSNEDFAPHCDWSAVAPTFSPAWLILLGVMNEARSWTGLVPIEPILARLSPETVKILKEPRFVVQVPKNVSTRLQLLSTPRPVLWDESGLTHVALPTYWIQPASGPDDKMAQAALGEIIRLVNDPQTTMRLVIQKGDALIFRNHRALHSRGKVDGRRLVLRTYAAGAEAAQLRSRLKAGNLLDVRALL
jgi:hypothetical protein